MSFVVDQRTVSGICSSFEGETVEAAVHSAISAEPDEEAYLSWNGTDQLCAVDFDCDPVYPFDDASLLTLLESFRPLPFVSWTTRGQGLRMLYRAQDPFDADEAGAVAALNLASAYPYRALELKRETRHPCGPDAQGRRCGTVFRREQSFDASSLRRHLGVYEATDAEVAAWLEEKNLTVGGRYDHSLCPVAPSDRGGRQPVFVGERGVYCFLCEAEGTCAGSGRPGFFPYSHFCGQRRATHLYRCLENATHWEHAKFVLEHAVDLPPQHARLVYSAGIVMLRSRDDARRAFAVGRDFVRMGDRWTNLNGESYSKDVKPLIAQLPACTYVEGEKRRIDRGRVVMFEQQFDLAKYGYPSLVPIFGTRMWPWNGDASVTAVVQTRELATDEAVELRPKYVPSADRMSMSSAWNEFERCCPGLNRELLQLLIAARGLAEGGATMPPMVFVTGPSGASKSMTPFLAASVCGDRNTEVVWTTNSDRLRQAVIQGAERGTYVTFNEVLKEARHQTKDPSHAMDYVLNLTPESVSWMAYIGPVRMGKLPAFVWTDTGLPQELKSDAQLARRIVHVQLSSQVFWADVWREQGLRHASDFRISSERRACACNAVLSDTIDRFLRPPRQFSDIAKELGFGLMCDSEESEERRDVLAVLFDAICNAPELDGADAQRWKGKGWKRVDRDIDTPIREAWLAVADDCFVSSRAASEVDWAKVAKLKEPARLETRSHGSRVALRFRSVAGTRVEYRVNGELR